MHKFNKFLVAIAVYLTFTFGSAFAFGGFSFGVSGSTVDFETDGREEETSGDNETTKTSVSKTVEVPGFFLEYTGGGDGSGPGFTIGLEFIPGEASIGTKSRTDANDISTDDGTYTGKAEVQDHATLYIEPTYFFSDSMGMYLKAGISAVTVNSLESISNGDDDSAYGNKDVLGAMGGLGFKARHASGLFMKLEGTKTVYEHITLQSTTGNKNRITAEPEATALKLAIGYNF